MTFKHWAGVTGYTSPYGFAPCCVFGKQSLPPGLCHLLQVAPQEVPLLPKLRGQFAEFLQHRYLNPLGILYQSTCVGLGYGLYAGAISWNTITAPTNPIRRNYLRHSSLPAGPGILTWFPSTTAFALALGADSPCAD